MPARTALDLFHARVAQSADDIAMRAKVDGVWQVTTWQEFEGASRALAGGLIDAGVAVGDRVIVLANTRLEWFTIDVAILMAGAITVPIYPSNTPEQCEYIINDCGATVVVVEDPHQLEKLYDPAVHGKLEHVSKIVYMTEVAELAKPDHRGRSRVALYEVLPADADRDRLQSFGDLHDSGERWLADHANVLDEIAASLEPDQAMTIVYTSGTTGPPKGVVISHAAMVFETNALASVLDFNDADEQLLFLPLAHIFAKIIEWSSIAEGVTTAFAESVPKLVANLKEVQPTFMGAVPRVYEKAYVKVQANIDATLQHGGFRAKLARWALEQGRRRAEAWQQGRHIGGPAMWLADKLVFGKVRATFGHNLRFFISGGAPLAKEIAEFFLGAGILILEGYGLTETTAATHLNTPDAFELGTVGPPLPGVEVRIAADGEICVRGPNVMTEYYRRPDKTAEAIDADGWFHTGDIGEITDRGMLRITDRKKDIIVTAGGKNVAPQNIEGHLKASCPYISQVMVYGDKRKFLSALITLNSEELLPWAEEHGVNAATPAALAASTEVRALIAEAVQALNAGLPSYETIKKYEILADDFSQETGELTPTLKVKRKFCIDKYGAVLDKFYEGTQSSL